MLALIAECWAEDLLSNKELIVTNYFNLSGQDASRLFIPLIPPWFCHLIVVMKLKFPV